MKNRSSGAVAGLRSRFGGDNADDAVVEERVRARLGRLVSHPSAVEVTVIQGEATLLGAVLEDELEGLLDGVAPELQGGAVGARRGRRHWRGTMEVQKTVDIAAPLEEVWALWSDFTRFPRFMTHLREACVTGPDRSHWVATGPLGAPVEWDAEITEWSERQRIAWRSVDASPVETAGEVRFRQRPDGGTRVELRLSCAPPAGALGKAVATFFGSHPKRQVDDDLLRLKSLLETGRTKAGGSRVRLEDVQADERMSG